MSPSPIRTMPKTIRRAVIQAITVGVLSAFLISFVYGFVYHYQQKRLHIEQLSALLANSASTPNGANLVARQVSTLLDDDPTLQSIVFYSTDHPIVNLDEATTEVVSGDWYDALFADTISFNQAVTSRYFDGSSIQRANSSQQLIDTSSISDVEIQSSARQFSARNTLVGYIDITLDINRLRWQWLFLSLLPWLATVAFTVLIVWFILRKLYWPNKDIIELAKVCEVATNNPKLQQLPAIQQYFDFQELIGIKKAFIILFDRLQQAKTNYEALAVFEHQLHNKDLSLNLQRYNFQGMITHELRTSLNAIVGGLQLLDHQSLNIEQKDALAIVRKGSQQLVRTLEQIIQLNKIEKGQVSINLSEFNPLQLIADLLAEYEPIGQKEGLELISHIHHIDYILEGDAAKIQQILSSLLDNAIKFTPSGQVTIKSQLTHFHESNRWQISVTDTGIGIADNHLEDIFNPFFQVDSSQTRAYEGTGIGLSVVKQMAQLIGAAIEVDSTPGVGSQFTVIIPLRNQDQVRQQYVLAGLVMVYYYYHEIGFMVDELRRLGATVTCQQYYQSIIEQISTIKMDMVMFAEDILPEQAATLARHIREHETAHRALLIYWYPQHQTHYSYSIEHGLKAAGVDYCHNAIRDDQVLSKQLKDWMV
jgi:signal transduction histidine kinase